jgi:hypothetical protein
MSHDAKSFVHHLDGRGPFSGEDQLGAVNTSHDAALDAVISMASWKA